MNRVRNHMLASRLAPIALLALAGVVHGQWQVTGNDIYYTAGNVGMGTSAPSFRVHAVESSSTNGMRAVYGLVSASTGVTNGVYGHTTSDAGRGVIGLASATSGVNFGLYGHSSSTSGRGAFGLAQATSGVTYGMFGQANSPEGRGVFGTATSTTGFATGVEGRSGSGDGRGVFGFATASDGATVGVEGRSNSPVGAAVIGNAAAPTGQNVGVYGHTNSAAGFGVFSSGNFAATGTKAFVIDHPNDPTNAYLVHYAIESPEVLNTYSGNVILDVNGEAVVELPPYFTSINKDPRYTLTAVGAPMPLLHVSRPVAEVELGLVERFAAADAAPARFHIAGGAAGATVSWRVDAVRNDLWVQTHGAPVEVPKPEHHRGTLLRPELYGMPEEVGQFYRPLPAE